MKNKGGHPDATTNAVRKVKRMNLIIDEEKHRKFKLATASQGQDMTAVILAFIDEYIKQHPVTVGPARKGGRA
jgi:hypothetical protein